VVEVVGGLVVVLFVATSSAVASVEAKDTQVSDFARPAALEPQVRFWRAIFAERSVHEVVLHDAFDVERVYAVLDFRPNPADSPSAASVERRVRRETDLALARLRRTLRRERGPRFDPTRVRAQRGMRERFAEALKTSGRYLPEMERIFRAQDLPVELTRLPLIESSFDLRAHSAAGAVGIWQFTRKTGRLFMRVDSLVDERRDPIAATRAAARFLRRLHERLGTWPLAITAYNHGPTGMARAVRETGTRDLGTIVLRYRGPAFGFASRNFYAEFLAALDVERDAARHFGPLEPDPPLRFRESLVAAPVHIRTASRRTGVDRAELARLNPALADDVVAGRRPIPAGYRMRLPVTETAASRPPGDAEPSDADAADGRSAAAGRADGGPGRRTGRRAAGATYRVRRGDTLTHVARRHGTTVAELQRLNGLRKDAPLRIGQRLVLQPTGTGG
jgi:membrane-bound lytic murein transglycosylase D